ncbi:putative P-loop containing nucleoside triphosphate hydrolase protein [Lyophyllum shimeji]|uniref:aminomethyltransferase n=1 Tax=Lyophyllum shimeji TaxID=47721 RepID=A0A9P3UNC6_LYOSH|nr:putative P-loop containing nucleoside triphosphate hydrolase protein [Lyophyllum shimeji]
MSILGPTRALRVSRLFTASRTLRLPLTRSLATATGAELRKTPLYDFHIDHGAKMVPFAGYAMPLVYDEVGQVASHNHVRTSAGLFDVSHMVQSNFRGPSASAFMEWLTPSSLSSLKPYHSTLSVLLNEHGGIIDDTIVTKHSNEAFYVVTNAGRRERDLAWMRDKLEEWNASESGRQGGTVEMEVMEGWGLLALQGPQAAAYLQTLTPFDLKQLTFGTSAFVPIEGFNLHVARGGYTGEDGFEISVPPSQTVDVAKLLSKPPVQLTGLGARDSLRLEAGMCLYGNELDEDVTPVEAGLTWVIPKERREAGGFIGAAGVQRALKEGPAKRRVGLVIEGAPARQGAKIFAPSGNALLGSVTSGIPSPTLSQNIAMGYVSSGWHKKGTEVAVDVRNKLRKAVVTPMPFMLRIHNPRSLSRIVLAPHGAGGLLAPTLRAGFFGLRRAGRGHVPPPPVLLVRGYAQGPGGAGGMPGFSFGPQHQKGEALKEYSVDLTEMARNGKLDPIIGRDEEIRRTIQILSRRTKSNPVLIGPPGVGKTAILEGLANRIVAKEVPDSLHHKRVLALDLAAIVAGSGIRGQFEEKFKALLRDIEDEAGNVICFIDELHTLFNLGKAEGTIDAGQMIKPALARGLQLVGATTPEEYRKTIGKDAALERRFQPVSIDEPNVESTISILRGLKPRYEVHHGVEISDAALVTAAVYSARYISDRFLPDKAIDLVDEAASALRLAQESKPDELEALTREIVTLEIELESLKNETDVFSVERREKVEETLRSRKEEAGRLEGVWQAERARLERIKDVKQRLEEAKHQLEVAQRQGEYELASRLRFATIPELERQLPAEGAKETQQQARLGMVVHDRVTSDDIARVVAKSTGIPVQNLLKGEREKLVHMEDVLRERVVGQDHVVAAISDAVRISRAGLQAPTRPVASFLFLGPTGVGKTELCKALAGFLFNDERRGLININMSEYHDRHTISRLIGAAPGYVGFEEGGQLTEAVRRKPYAVILLDELEKAHKDVAMILLQILDEGSLTDSQGRKVDFKNTIICLTSNLGSDILAHPTACDANGLVTPEARTEVLQRVSEYFPPELLNRLDSMLVFNKLSRKAILDVVALRLRDVAERLKPRRITLEVDDNAREWLAESGYSDVYGARAIARIVRTDVLFPLAQKLLRGTIRDGDMVKIRVSEDRQALVIQDNHAPDPTAIESEEGAPTSDVASTSNELIR